MQQGSQLCPSSDLKTVRVSYGIVDNEIRRVQTNDRPDVLGRFVPLAMLLQPSAAAVEIGAKDIEPVLSFTRLKSLPENPPADLGTNLGTGPVTDYSKRALVLLPIPRLCSSGRRAPRPTTCGRAGFG